MVSTGEAAEPTPRGTESEPACLSSYSVPQSRIELLTPQQYRSDGRRPLELRSLELVLSPSTSAPSKADGCSRVTHGLTRVAASVYGPREARKRSDTVHDRATLVVEVGIGAGAASGSGSGIGGGGGGVAGGEARRSNKGDRRLVNIANTIKDTFEPVLQLRLFPRSCIFIYVEVLEADGGILPAALNAVTLALIDAGIPTTDYVLSLTYGLHPLSPTPLLDLSGLEEQSLPNLTLALLPRAGTITLATTESRVHIDRVEACLEIAPKAMQVLLEEVDAAVRERTRRLARALDGVVLAVQGVGDGGDEGDDTEMEEETADEAE